MNTLKLKRVIAYSVFLTIIGCLFFVYTGYAEDRFTGTISASGYDADIGNFVTDPSPSPSPSPNPSPSPSPSPSPNPSPSPSPSPSPNPSPIPSPSPNPELDTQPPSVPARIAASVVSSTQIAVRWYASTDNTGVSGYNLFRDGSQVATISSTSYTDTGLQPSTTYSYRVSAFDAAGNESGQSPSSSATTNNEATPSDMGTITGIVSDAHTGKPITVGGPVMIKEVSYGVMHSAQTDSSGRYTVNVPRARVSGGMGIYWFRYQVMLAWGSGGYDAYTSEELSFSEGVNTIEHNVALVPQPTGILSGQVTDADTKKPLANVSITFKPQAYGYGAHDYTTTTDSGGNYYIENVTRYVSSSGGQIFWLSYTAYVEQPGYAPYIGTAQTFSALVWDAGVDIRLEPLPSYQGTITGIVIDAQNGKPLSGGTVMVRDVSYGITYSATTDSNGRYTVNVPRSKSTPIGVGWLHYTVNLVWGGYNAYTSEELSFSEGVNTIEHNVALVPQPTGILSGQVTDADTKKPLANVSITFKPNSYGYGAHDYTTTTDSGGNYYIENVTRYVSSSGGQIFWLSYTAYVNHPGYEAYTSPALVFSQLVWNAGMDIALKPLAQGMGTITGIVTDAQTGKPLPGGPVMIKEVSYGVMYSAQTDSSGRYTVNVPRARVSGGMGIYWFRYQVMLAWGSGGYDVYTSEELSFSEGVTTIEHNVALVPYPTGAFSGNVTDAQTGKPLANVTVTFKRGAQTYTTTTDSLGNYYIEDVLRYVSTSGGQVTWLNYEVHVEHSGYEYYVGTTQTFSALVWDAGVDIALNPLPSYMGTITGIVTDASTGKPITDGWIWIQDVAYGIDYRDLIDSQGRFTTNVPRSKVSGGMGIYWYRYKIIINFQGYNYYEAEVVFSEEVSIIEHDVVLIPASRGMLIGEVTDADTNEPIPDVAVTFKPNPPYYGTQEYTTTTDSYGSYSIENVLRYLYDQGVHWLGYQAYVEHPGYESYTGTIQTFSASAWAIREDIALKPLPLAEVKQDIYLDTSHDESTQFAKPQVICDDTGYVVVAWQKQVDSMQSTGHLYSRTSLDCGLNWEPAQEVSQGNAASRVDDAQLGHDGKGNAYLSWRMTQGNHQYLYLTRTLNHGYTWVDDKLIKDTALLPEGQIVFKDYLAPAEFNSQSIHLKCQDNSGRVYILETQYSAEAQLDKLLLVCSLDQGQTWNEIELGAASDLKDLAMTCDNNGNAYIVGIKNISAATSDAIEQKAVVFKAIAVQGE